MRLTETFKLDCHQCARVAELQAVPAGVCLIEHCPSCTTLLRVDWSAESIDYPNADIVCYIKPAVAS
jgi:hypothetical protein